MKFSLKIEGDVLTFTAAGVEPTPEDRGRVCHIELALLRHYGNHASYPVVTDADGKLAFRFVRGGSDHALLDECREILHKFAIEV